MVLHLLPFRLYCQLRPQRSQHRYKSDYHEWVQSHQFANHCNVGCSKGAQYPRWEQESWSDRPDRGRVELIGVQSLDPEAEGVYDADQAEQRDRDLFWLYNSTLTLGTLLAVHVISIQSVAEKYEAPDDWKDEAYLQCKLSSNPMDHHGSHPICQHFGDTQHHAHQIDHPSVDDIFKAELARVIHQV